jgi:glucose-6-phosphate isomerase
MMRTRSRTFVATVVALAWTTTSSAQDHIVSAEAVSARLLEAGVERSAERTRLQALLSSAERDGDALMRWHARRAAPKLAMLSDEEMHDLAARASALAADRAAGGLTNAQIWLISIGGSLLLAATVLVAYELSCDEQCSNNPL